MFPKDFGKMAVNALLHVLVTIGRVFVLPLTIWVKATSKLVDQKGSNAFDINAIQTPWPYFSWCKRWVIDFGFDACIFITYIIGVIVAFIGFFQDLFSDYLTFGDALTGFITVLVVVYLSPLYWAFVRDFIVFLLLPVNKFLDWLKKPAQYYEIKKNE